MRIVNKAIREATGLNLQEFCEQELHTGLRAFSARLHKNSLYPNEMIYIALRTGKTLKQLFGQGFDDLFLLKGSPELNDSIKVILSDPATQGQLKDLIGFDVRFFSVNTVMPPRPVPVDKIKEWINKASSEFVPSRNPEEMDDDLHEFQKSQYSKHIEEYSETFPLSEELAEKIEKIEMNPLKLKKSLPEPKSTPKQKEKEVPEEDFEFDDTFFN